MKIFIDDGLSTIVKLTGIGYQAHNLYLSLKKISDCSISDYSFLKKQPRYLRRFLYIAYANYGSAISDYDILHYQNYYVPRFSSGKKKIVTIHDLGAFKFPETIPYFYVKYNQHSIRSALKRADGIITPSKSIKKEILEMFPKTKEERILPCEDGIREIFWDPVDSDHFLLENEIKPFQYFFFIGSLSPRKNLKFILEAFTKAKLNGWIKKESKLVLAGQSWWGSSDFNHLLREDLGIKTLGYIEDKCVAQLYKYSKALIFPSLYEGFGMPIIEAMSQNSPIIISNIPTSLELNELHNNQMFGFNLGDEAGFIELLKKLDHKNDDIRKSLNYGDLSRYRFDNIAKRHYDFYEKILDW